MKINVSRILPFIAAVLLSGGIALGATSFPPGVLQQGSVTANDCVQWVGNNLVKDSGGACGGGTGGGTPGGSTGQFQYNAGGGNFGGITLSAHQSVRAVATTALTATYSNGTAGVGATLTNAGAQASLAIDQLNVNVGDRVLIPLQASTFQNGIYTVTNAGSGVTNWVLTRATDFDGSIPGSVAEGATISVTEGVVNPGAIYIENGQGPFTIGTTAIVFVQNAAGSIAGGALPALTITGSGGASASPFNLTGTPEAGTGTTSTPLEYFNNATNQPSTWATGGTYSGINAVSGFGGNFVDYHINGGASVYSVNAVGSIVTNGSYTSSKAGGASLSPFQLTGTLETGGSGTTNFPHIFYQPSSGAAAVTTWSTAGTVYGANTASGFTGNFLDFHVNGASTVLSISSTGFITATTGINTGTGSFNNRIASTFGGAASSSPFQVTGALYAAGTGTTNFPQYFAQPSGATAATSWSTAGTVFGANEASGFTGNFSDFRVNGGSSLFSVSSTGQISTAGGIALSAANISTDTTTGTQIATGSTQKLGFFGATPVAQQTGNIVTALANLGLVTSGTIPSSTPITNSLGSDVTMTTANTYYDGPSVAQGTSGTWFASGTVTLVTGGATTDGFSCKLWDGATVIASAKTTSVLANPLSISLSGYLTSPAANIRISCTDTTNNSSTMKFNISGNSKDSTVTAHLIP